MNGPMLRFLMVGLLSLAICSCASIPLSTMVKFAGFDEEDFLEIPPDEIEAKFILTDNVKIDLLSANIAITATNEKGERNFEFPLELISHETQFIEAGWLSKEDTVNKYHMRMSERGKQDYLRFQHALKNEFMHQEGTFSLQAGAKLLTDETDIDANTSPGNLLTELSVLIQLTESKGFFTLIDAADINLAASE